MSTVEWLLELSEDATALVPAVVPSSDAAWSLTVGEAPLSSAHLMILPSYPHPLRQSRVLWKFGILLQ